MKTEVIKNNKGIGLVEIILAMGIFALVASSIISLVLGGNVALEQGGEQTKAEALAQEGLEAVKSIREGAWNELIFSKSSVATSTGQWVFSGEGIDETIGQFKRIITFNDVCRDVLQNITTCPGFYNDKYSKLVKIEIIWEIRPGVTNTVEQTAYLTNWDSHDWIQTDWSSGAEQSIWSNESAYESDDGNIDNLTSGEIKLASIGGGSCGLKTWNFTSAAGYTFDSDIEIAGGAAQLKPTVLPNWWDANFSNRKEISITNVGSTVLTDFAVYLKINKETVMKPDFSDLRFTSGACSSVGALLNYEIESSDLLAANVWVKVPSFSTSVNKICMYYGNPSATSAQNVNGTWDDNYVAVHHLEETSGTHFDSSFYANNGINNGAVQGSVGIVDSCDYFNTSTANVNLGTAASLKPTNAITYSAWVKSAGTVTQWQAVGGSASNTSWVDGYGIFFNSANTISFYVGNYINNVATGSITPVNWNYVVGTYDMAVSGTTQVKIYVNGVLAGTDNYSSAINYSGGSFTIGEIGAWTSSWLNGYIDETRISNIARSADWINQNYQLIANQNSYVSFASPENSATYPTTRPTIRPTVSYSVSGAGNWTSFTENATKGLGTEIYYQLSKDKGETWLYWNGFTWAVAGSTNYNIVSDVNSNISTFATSTAQIMFKAFLLSSGTEQVKLNSISLNCAQNFDWPFTFSANYVYDPLKIYVNSGVAQLKGLMATTSWSTINSGFDTNALGWTGVPTWIVAPSKTNSTNYVSIAGNPGGYVNIRLPGKKANSSAAYWYQDFTTTTSNPTATLKFDRRILSRINAPSSYHLYAYIDTDSGNPTLGTEVWDSGNITSTGAWISVPQFDISSKITSPGTYYLKFAAYQTCASNKDCTTVTGFDNVIVNWSGMGPVGYPVDSPTIQPIAAYSVTNLDQYSSFIETAVKTGASEIYYQLSDNSGATWKYWNGLTWATAGSTNYNLATVVNTNIPSFATSTASIIFKAFLLSNGTDQVQLDNVRIGWSEAGTGGVEGYQIFGSLISSAFNMGDASPVQIIEWEETPALGGDIKLQIRTASDASNTPGVWSDWYGLNGANSYYSDPGQYLISTNLNGRQWVQYRAEISGDGTATPILEKVKINYK